MTRFERWHHDPTRVACADVRLEVLLFGEEQSTEFQNTATHVESCPACRDRLATLAGSDEEWAEVRDVLKDDDADRALASHDGQNDVSRKGAHGPQAFAARSPRLDFLAPPSHPEMLGRLGRYEIEQTIGAGGMGIVLKAFDTELNRPVAIKVLAPHLAHSGAARQRFAREARAAAAVVHEHVVAIHNVESDGAPDAAEAGRDVPFLVMQYVPGRSLAERVEQDGPLEPAEILRIGSQAAAGLAAAHAQGVIHRDVKPANILLENGVERVLLTDFGLARAAEDASLTRSGIIAGTPHYMSPEQARGEAVDARSDLFSLGSVLYFMAAGHPPFRAEQAMAVLHRICHGRHRAVWEINSSIPDELADVIDRLLEKKPGRRFASATEAQQALAGALRRLQQGRSWPAGRWLCRLRRRRGRFWIAAAVMAAATAAAWLAWPPAREGGGESSPSDSKTATAPSASPHAPNVPRPVPSAAGGTALSVSDPGAQQIDAAGELAALNQALSRFAAQPDPESVLLLQFGDPWQKELRAADAEATRFEKSWSIEPVDRPR
jgi:serine/threonine protein kinase